MEFSDFKIGLGWMEGVISYKISDTYTVTVNGIFATYSICSFT
jgi:hypothetical protein